MPTSPPRRSAATTVLDSVAGSGGTDEVIRDGASLLVRRGEVLARVRPVEDTAVARREVALARRLVADGVPVTPVVGDDMPRTIGGHVVSTWRWCQPVEPADAASLGLLTRLLRERTPPAGPAGLPRFDPIAHIAAIVGPCGDTPDVCFVRERAEELAAPFARAVEADPLGACVVHGDLHADNVIVTADGPVLTDLELGGWGPAGYDLAPMAVAVRRYGVPAEDMARFADASGVEVGGWEGFETFAAVFELWVTAWAVSVADRNRTWADEASRRVATLRDGADELWRLS